ncbi:hypothetical protein BCR43DRAFT_515507 [Syncephalastrum racemosum]|uniref:SH3 domain-containing protein n=1 Tax=Syncephalastrum racemosum TaxID=13706 RepID=A0A1X2H9N1_SYNRA|nr:hypothetical protein BCR43DRAFT_515507 [Syncephalastrum racemosum]
MATEVAAPNGAVHPPPAPPGARFADSFWDANDAGVDVLVERLRKSKQTCEEIRKLYEIRSQIEEDYGERLLKLSQLIVGQEEEGTLYESLSHIPSALETTGRAHLDLAQQLKHHLEAPLDNFVREQRDKRRTQHQHIENARQLKNMHLTNAVKAKEFYTAECTKVAGMEKYLRERGQEMPPDEVQQLKEEIDEGKKMLAAADQEYRRAIEVLTTVTTDWTNTWRTSCDTFQEMEEKRIDFVHNSLWSFSSMMSSVYLVDDQCCERIRTALEHVNVQKDVEAFIARNTTGTVVPETMRYEPFSALEIQTPPSQSANETKEQTPKDDAIMLPEAAVAATAVASAAAYTNASPKSAEVYEPTLSDDVVAKQPVDTHPPAGQPKEEIPDAHVAPDVMTSAFKEVENMLGDDKAKKDSADTNSEYAKASSPKASPPIHQQSTPPIVPPEPVTDSPKKDVNATPAAMADHMRLDAAPEAAMAAAPAAVAATSVDHAPSPYGASADGSRDVAQDEVSQITGADKVPSLPTAGAAVASAVAATAAAAAVIEPEPRASSSSSDRSRFKPIPNPAFSSGRSRASMDTQERQVSRVDSGSDMQVKLAETAAEPELASASAPAPAAAPLSAPVTLKDEQHSTSSEDEDEDALPRQIRPPPKEEKWVISSIRRPGQIAVRAQNARMYDRQSVSLTPRPSTLSSPTENNNYGHNSSSGNSATHVDATMQFLRDPEPQPSTSSGNKLQRNGPPLKIDIPNKSNPAPRPDQTQAAAQQVIAAGRAQAQTTPWQLESNNRFTQLDALVQEEDLPHPQQQQQQQQRRQLDVPPVMDTMEPSSSTGRKGKDFGSFVKGVLKSNSSNDVAGTASARPAPSVSHDKRFSTLPMSAGVDKKDKSNRFSLALFGNKKDKRHPKEVEETADEIFAQQASTRPLSTAISPASRQGPSRRPMSYMPASNSSQPSFQRHPSQQQLPPQQQQGWTPPAAEPQQDNNSNSSNSRAPIDRVRAIWSYEAKIPSEMSFMAGDLLAVFNKQADGWWEAELMDPQRRQRGLVPGNYMDPA